MILDELFVHLEGLLLVAFADGYRDNAGAVPGKASAVLLGHSRRPTYVGASSTFLRRVFLVIDSSSPRRFFDEGAMVVAMSSTSVVEMDRWSLV